jgi:transposase-like protein
MHEINEHSPLAGETWRDALMQEKRGIPRALALLWRGACLRCPRCGARSLFRTWFAMHERCTVCGLRFEREQGYFLGAMHKAPYGRTLGTSRLASGTSSRRD